MKRIAIQGVKGSYHDIAARCYFKGEDIELVCCDTFEALFGEMKRDGSLLALVAIENTIAGSILHNYELLRESGLTIVGEHKLRISHSLICLPGDDWDDIAEVESHPVALAQCYAFLKRHPGMRMIETDDTAGAAEQISRKQLRGHAAICSKYAASLYGMKILEEGIEDNKHNFTRFLVLADPRLAGSVRDARLCNKSSLVFALPHEEGSLSQALSIFSFYKINLTKIQSLPIIGREWEYLFYIDVMYGDPTRFQQCLEAIKPLISELRILGEYVSGQ